MINPRKAFEQALEEQKEAVSPPEWEETVLKMKKHPEITNPWALSWWMKGEGYTPGGKKEASSPRVVFEQALAKQAFEECSSCAEKLAAECCSKTAATDLKDLRKIALDWYKKHKELAQRKEEADRQYNEGYNEAHIELEQGTTKLLEEIRDALVEYFSNTDRGVRKESVQGGLVEVFLGSDDGIQRAQSKVSALVQLTFKGISQATWMFRNERGDKKGNLSPENTVQKLMDLVKKADKAGFWDQDA